MYTSAWYGIMTENGILLPAGVIEDGERVPLPSLAEEYIGAAARSWVDALVIAAGPWFAKSKC